MVRFLPRNIFLKPRPSLPLSSVFCSAIRRCSSKSAPGSIIEIDLSAASSASNSNTASEDDGESMPVDAATILSKLEDAITYISLLRSTPIWLPFIPGSSFWVPPKLRPLSVPEFVDEWSNRLTFEEFHSLATCRGFPSSAFYLTDTSSATVDLKTSVAVAVVNMSPPSDAEFVAWARGGVDFYEQGDGVGAEESDKKE